MKKFTPKKKTERADNSQHGKCIVIDDYTFEKYCEECGNSFETVCATRRLCDNCWNTICGKYKFDYSSLGSATRSHKVHNDE